MTSHFAILALALVGSVRNSPVRGAIPVGLSAYTDATLVSTATAPPASVILVIKENFGGNDMAALVRRFPGPNPVNIIAVKRSALTPELLSAALTLMNASIGKHGEPSRAQVFASIPTRARLHAIDAATRTKMTAAINQLLGSPPVDVPHVGRVRATVVPAGA